MKRVNLKLLVALVSLVVLGCLGTYFLHRYQVSRNAGGLAKLAREKLDEGKPDEALALFGRYLGYRRDDREALAEYSELLLDRAERPGSTRADLSRAYTLLEEAVRKNPGNHPLRRRLAEFQLRIGRFGDAREHLRVLLAACGPDGSIPIDAPRRSKAEEAADGDAKNSLNRFMVDLLLARSWAGSGNYDEAAGVVAELVDFDLTSRTFKDGPGEETTKEVPEEGDGSPVPTDAYVLLAAILDEKLTDNEAAKRVLDRLIDVKATDAQAWLAYAKWSRQQGDMEAASRAVEQAKSLAPEDPETLLASFELAISERNLDAAAQVIQGAMEKFPADERVIRGSSLLAMQRGEQERAVKILEDGLKRAGPQPGLLLMLADVLMQSNRIDDVEATIPRLKEVLGASSPAVGLIEARVLVARQKWLQAKQKLDRVRPMVAASPELTRQVDLYLGQCYERLGQYDEQLEANRRVLSDDPSSLAARVGAASALVASGKPEQALAEFEIVASSIPKDRLPAIPQVWSPLLQLRIAMQSKRPERERDWSQIDALMELLGGSEAITDEQIAILRADLLVRKGETKDAMELLAKAAASNPSSVPLRSALVTLELRQNGAEAAQAAIDAASDAIRKDPAFMIVEAQVASRRADAKDTAGQLSKIEARAAKLDNPDDASRVLSGIASFYYSIGQRSDSERVWEEVLKLRPDDLRIRMAVLDMARDENNVAKAKAAAMEIAKLAGPTSAQGRFAEATARVLDVRVSQRNKLTKDDVQAVLSREERANLQEARNLLIEAENERPGWVEIQQLFSEIDGLEGDVPSSIERLQKAVRLGPGNPAVVRQLVALLYASNRFDEAQQVLSLLGPDGLSGFERISAEMELRSGKVDEAVAIAERSVAADSKNAGELLWLGQLLSRSRKGDRAEEVLSRAVEAAPDRPETWLSLMAHQIGNGRTKAAERTLAKGGEAIAGTDSALFLSQGSEMLGRLDDAGRFLEEAVAEDPKNVVAIRALAAFDIRRGRLGPARDLLEKLVAVEGNAPVDRASKVWARRTLAELTAERGSYPMLQKAMALLDQNAGADGKLGAEDRAIAIRMLADRPEPASWRKAVEMLSDLSKVQPLSIGQRLLVAQLREKLGQWEDCRSELVSLVASPDAPPAIYAMLVERLIDHDEFSSARTWLARLQDKSPDAPITLALEAKLALAEKDRPTAIAAAKKLMPSGPVPLEQVPQLKSTGKLMEDLGFPKAADKVLSEFASRSLDGVVARAEFLGRQKRPDEALDLLDTAWDRLPLEKLLQTAVVVARSQGSDLDAKTSERLERWFAKASRQDPDSVVIGLLDAERRELIGRTGEVESIYRDLLARKDLSGTQRAIVANNLAFHLARDETAKEALALVDKAISELGPHPDLLDTRGVVQLELGNATQALSDLKEASLVPTAVKLLHLAAAQAEGNQIESAKRTLQAAKKMGLLPQELQTSDRERLEKLEAKIGSQLGA